MAKLIEVPTGTNTIEVRKNINRMLSEAREKSKPQVCILCGKKQTSFCNSHSVPKMVLRAIADNGKVLLASSVMGIDKEIHNIEDGVNASGTFHYICRECDGTFFQDYENESNIVMPPSDKMLSEIAVKNFLLQLSKRAVERKLQVIQQRELNAFINLQLMKDIKDMDYAEFEEEVKFHKRIADNNMIGQYHILFWKVLPYTVPIATQSLLLLNKDLEGVEVNNPYDMNPNVRMQYLHLAIFPLDGQSVIVLFHHKRDKAYRRLGHQLNSMAEGEVFKYINYLVFKYTENYYISKKIENEINTNESLQELSQEYNEFPSLGMLGENNNYGKGYTPIGRDEIPNFLSPEWAV